MTRQCPPGRQRGPGEVDPRAPRPPPSTDGDEVISVPSAPRGPYPFRGGAVEAASNPSCSVCLPARRGGPGRVLVRRLRRTALARPVPAGHRRALCTALFALACRALDRPGPTPGSCRGLRDSPPPVPGVLGPDRARGRPPDHGALVASPLLVTAESMTRVHRTDCLLMRGKRAIEVPVPERRSLGNGAGCAAMADYTPFIVFGLITGSIYGSAAMGLVLTYKTSGVFNLAHGAVCARRPTPSTICGRSRACPGRLAFLLVAVVFGPLVGPDSGTSGGGAGAGVDRLPHRRHGRPARRHPRPDRLALRRAWAAASTLPVAGRGRSRSPTSRSPSST